MAKRTKRLTSQGEEPEAIRINKFLSDAGVCSRREADRYITEGNVKIDGVIAEMGSRVMKDSQVTFFDKPVTREEKLVLIAFNKPEGIVCTADQNEPDNIIDFINYGMRIYPIGRLDKDSEGLILLTNDGNIVNKILRAENKHEKEYIVTVNKEINAEFIKGMSSGVPILDTVTNPCTLNQIDKFTFNIILTQGLNRQIRRMCEYFGYRVVNLKRVRIMNIQLGRLKTGDYRNVTEKEIEDLNESFQTQRSSGTPKNISQGQQKSTSEDAGRKPAGRRLDARKPEGRKYEGRKYDGRKYEGRKPEQRDSDVSKPELRKFDVGKSEQRRSDQKYSEQGKSDYRKSAQGRSEQEKPDYRKSVHGRSEQEKPDYRKSIQGRSEQEKPDYRKSVQGRSEQEKPDYRKSVHGRSEYEKPDYRKSAQGRSDQGKPEFKKSDYRKTDDRRPQLSTNEFSKNGTKGSGRGKEDDVLNSEKTNSTVRGYNKKVSPNDSKGTKTASYSARENRPRKGYKPLVDFNRGNVKQARYGNK